MIEDMDVRMMDEQAGMAGGQGRRTPVKAELRQKIQSRRRAQGQDDLSQEGLFKEPEKHELTAEEKERKERRRFQNRMAARRCREKKKKQQMYTREEFQQVSDERDHFKKLSMEMMDLVKKHNIPIPVKREAEDVSEQPCASSSFAPFLIKTEPGLERRKCQQQGSPRYRPYPTSELRALLSPVPGSECSALLSPPSDCSVSPDFTADPVFASDLLLPILEPYRYPSDPLTTPGGSPEGPWGRGLPSTSDSDYAGPQSCESSVECVGCPSPDLPCTQASTGFDNTGVCSPDSTSMGMSSASDMSFYPATPDTPQPDCSTTEQDREMLEFIKNLIKDANDDVFTDANGNVDSPFTDWQSGL